MSMEDYEKAIALMNQYPNLQSFVGPQSVRLIEAAEEILGIKFPATYRRFLLEYGAGGFGGTEMYGIVHEDFENSCLPDAIWCTLSKRRKWGLPADWVIIYDDGMVSNFCLRCENQDDKDASVVTWVGGLSLEEQRPELIAPDFGAFLLKRVQFEIKTEEETEYFEDDEEDED